MHHTPPPAPQPDPNPTTCSVPPLISLPTAFCAFYDLNYPGYLDYARAQLTPATAPAAVACSFGLLATHWTTAVAHPNPTAYAWRLHTAHLARRLRKPLTLKDDIAILHDQLDYSVKAIAELTGQEPAAISCLLAAVRRDRSRPQPTSVPVGRQSGPSATARAVRRHDLVAPGALR